MKTVVIRGETMTLKLSHYQQGNGLYVGLLDRDRLPYAHVSCNLSSQPAKDCFWLKDWSENEAVAAALLSQGVIELTGRVCPTGFVEAKEARLK